MTASHYAEYAALRATVAALDRVGLRGAVRFADWLGRVGYSPLGIRRRVVEEQIAASFPDLATAEVARIARGAYQNLARTTIEGTLLPLRSRDELLAMAEGVDGWPELEAAWSRGRGVIFAAGHVGNWELAGAYIAARRGEIDVVARHMANPMVDGFITRTRGRLGMRVIYDDQAVKQVPRALRSGRGVAFLTDQAGAGLASTWIPFLGRMAKTARGPAVFALRLGSPIFFGGAIRQPDGRYRLVFEEVPVTPTGDRERDVDQIVKDYTAVLERWVRRVPEQYFWHHRRWKNWGEEREHHVIPGG
jgi:KDO2-lipid IV(A) lauroyltransferase